MKHKFLVILLAIVATLCMSFGLSACGGTCLDFTLSEDGTAYTVTGVGKCKDKNLVIPAQHKGKPVTSIRDRAFDRCSWLTSITIPDEVTEIGDYAFFCCSGLTSIDIPDSVTEIGDYAFTDCSGLASVTIGGGVTSIGSSAFAGCSGLTSVTIPDSVASIGEFAFAYCYGLTSITIPDSVTSIGKGMVYDCSNLKEVHISDLEAWCEIEFEGWLCNQNYYFLYLNGEKITALEIPDSVTTIGEWAFAGCSGLTSVTIGNGVTSIGESAFAYCGWLTSVTIGSGVTEIGEYAFGDCYALEEVYFKNPNGWKVSEHENMSDAEAVSGLEDPAKAAKYLTDTYPYYDWKREG